jgi:hypothetical protein
MPDQLGVACVEDKDRILALLDRGDVPALAGEIRPEGGLLHPMLEIYEQFSQNRKGDALLTVKETVMAGDMVRKRAVVGHWEIFPEDLRTLKEHLPSA